MNLMKWNISVIRGKEIKKDFVSSGERKWKKVKIVYINEQNIFGKSNNKG